MGFTSIERDGDTLWRPASPSNHAVHALLMHLHDVGFEGAPRSMGVADDGRHQLSWVEGESGDAAGDSDERLISMAQLIRRYHDAVRTFVPPAGLAGMIGAPEDGPIVCHNDLSPVNTVFVDDQATALIDWDFAGPGDREWDLAYAAWRSVPLYDDAFFVARDRAIPDRGRRLRLFVDAYDLQRRDNFAEVIVSRIQSLYDTARMRGGRLGEPGWVEVWRDTQGRQWLASRDFAQDNASRWAAALTS